MYNYNTKALYTAAITTYIVFSCNADNEKDTRHTGGKARPVVADNLVYLINGPPESIDHAQALRDVMKRYNATVEGIAGCVITDSLQIAIDRNNKLLFNSIWKKYSQTETRVNEEIASLAKTYAHIYALADKDNGIGDVVKAAGAANKTTSIELCVWGADTLAHVLEIRFSDSSFSHQAMATFVLKNGKWLKQETPKQNRR